MILISHRGLINDNIKENTLESFKNAINNNYNGIELDIRITKDNKIVVLHDKLINRTSNAKGNINNLLYKDVVKYNFGSKTIPSKLPLLEDVIKKFNNIIIFIELKEKINKDLLLDILKLNDSNDYYIMSFNKNYINEFLNTKYKIGLINNIFNSKNDISLYDFSVVLENLFTVELYNRLIKKNKEIVLYGVLNNISLKNKELLAKIKYII